MKSDNERIEAFLKGVVLPEYESDGHARQLRAQILSGLQARRAGKGTGRWWKTAALLLGLLAATVGLPYFVLSATGPLVQAWVARRGQVPYRLFALSNLASMLALLSYPMAVEPLLPLRTQAWSWSAGFLAFAGLMGTLAWRNARAVVPALPDGPAPPAPPPGRRLSWILLAALPTVLLMAVTSHLSTNVAPIPFLWVVPLALYLLSFIICSTSKNTPSSTRS